MPRGRKVDSLLIEKVSLLRSEGLDVYAIAASVKLHYETVKKICRGHYQKEKN